MKPDFEKLIKEHNVHGMILNTNGMIKAMEKAYELGKLESEKKYSKLKNNTLDKQYQSLLIDILDNGVIKSDRTGTGTKSVFGRQIRHKMSEGFPLLTTKKMAWKTMVVELLWFLRGETNIKFLLDYDCHIWDGDAYKNYLHKVIRDKDIVRYLKSYSIDTKGVPTIEPYLKDEFIERIKNDDEFAKKWGDLGPIYGKQWRKWSGINHLDRDFGHLNTPKIDQIDELIKELKTNPDSRRLIVSAWNVGALDAMVLPPCHYGFQIYTKELSESERFDWYGNKIGSHMHHDHIVQEMNEKNVPTRSISLMWNQRSVDTFLGLPFNIASYGLLLEIIAKEVNMVPDELIGNLGDVHLYLNHIEQAKEQIGRTPYELPSVKITERNWYMHEAVKEHLGEKTLDEKLKSYRPDCFELIGYESHPKIKAPLSN
jgi:thymidylate synthase